MTRNVRRNKKLASEYGKRGVKAKAEKKARLFGSMRVVGRIETYGCMGRHTIELLYGDNYSEKHLAVMLDGMPKAPRTPRGLWKCIAEMCWGKVKDAMKAVRRWPAPEYMI